MSLQALPGDVGKEVGAFLLRGGGAQPQALSLHYSPPSCLLSHSVLVSFSLANLVTLELRENLLQVLACVSELALP